MPTFTAAHGQFWLDDQPQLFQAGEFHYYRTPADQWRHRLTLLQDAGFNAVASYIPWRWHQVAEGVSDFDGHSHPMRNLAGFLDLAAEMGLLIMARPGPYIMAETINEGIPDWVFTHYPQTAFISQDRVVQNVVSYLHPDFLKCVRQWFQAVFAVLTPRQITRQGQIVMVQLDNEMGMIQWVRNILDVNPDTLARFAGYLRHTYGADLPQRYPAADLPAFLEAGLVTPAAPYAAAIVEDYRRFYQGYLREYTEFLVATAQAHGLEVPPIVNIHGFMNGGKTFPIGLSQLVGAIELEGMLSATDVYPGTIVEGTFHQLVLLNAMTKALQNPQQPLFSAEFQAGGNHDFGHGQSSFYDLHTRLCLSTGMRAINHYLFFSGENDPLLSPTRRHDWGHPVRTDGTLRNHYPRYGELSRVLAVYGDALTLARPVTVTTIGFQLDDFMTEVNTAFTQPAANVIIHQREEILFDFIGKGLALLHTPYDALEVSRAELDPQRTPVVWMMLEKQCPAATQAKLVEYARQGGRLVLVGRLCVEDGHHQPCTLLRDALGIQAIAGDPPFARSEISALGHRDIPVTFKEIYTGAFESVIATDAAGATVGFSQRLGQGRVVMFGAAVPANTLEDLDLVRRLAQLVDCPPLLTLSAWADARLSRGDQGSFLFLNNYLDDPVATTIAVAGGALFGGHPVALPARRGLILPLEWRLNEAVTVHYATAELTAVEAADGQLTLRTRPDVCVAELSLTGYTCDGAVTISETGATRRVQVRSHNGVIVLNQLG